MLGAAIIGGGIYGVYTLLSSNTTTILYRSTVDDKINAIRPYIVALDAYNSYSVAYANQLQPTLEELRNGSDVYKRQGLYSSEYRFLFFVKVSIFIDKTILHQEILK